jgi:hypothetical protein
MNCSNCSKTIPEGFSDCPWCGEPASVLSRAMPPPFPGGAVTAKPLGPGLGVAWLVLPMSLVVVIFAAYQATARQYGAVSLERSAFLLGACAGPYLVSAFILFVYSLIARKKIPASTKFLATFCGASLFAVLSLLHTSRAAGPNSSPARMAHAKHQPVSSSQNPKPQPVRAPTVWDPAIVSLYSDLKVNNEAYVAAVSQLDLTAEPLYLPDSFRDSSTIQKMLVQLQDRLAVADKFSSLDSIVAKMPQYVAAINASDADKRQFLATFMPTIQQSVANRTAASAYEHDWLRTSVGLYQFMLANQSAYTISSDGKTGTFRNRAIGADFDQRLRKAQELKQKFLQAQRAYLTGQSDARAQFGMPE